MSRRTFPGRPRSFIVQWFVVLGLFLALPALASAWTYPVVASIEPSSGTMAGGTVVRVRGSGFDAAQSWAFGSWGLAGRQVVSSSEVLLTTPPGLPGPVELRMGGVEHEAPTIGVGTFTYLPAPEPAVRKLSPDIGWETPGMKVSITGYNLAGALEVTFGGLPGTDLFYREETGTLEVRAPGRAYGPDNQVDVRVRTAAGWSQEAGHLDNFTFGTTYISGGALEGGGQQLEILNVDTTNVVGVTFDGVPGLRFRLDGNQGDPRASLFATVPLGFDGGDIAAVFSDGHTRVLTQLEPDRSVTTPFWSTPPGSNSGPRSGGTPLLVSGGLLHKVSAWNFGTLRAASASVFTGAEVRLVSPPSTKPGRVQINAGSQWPQPLLYRENADFTYTDPVLPVVTGFSPAVPPAYQSSIVMLRGVNLTGTSVVRFGSHRATPLFSTDKFALVLVPPLPWGTYRVTVDARSGRSPAGTYAARIEF